MARKWQRSAARADQRGDVIQLGGRRYAGLLPSEMKRLSQLEEENSKLKRIVADLSLDKVMLQDVLSKKLKRELVDNARRDWKVSIRRACSALRIDRTLYVYKSKRGDHAALKGRIKDISETRVRYGCRRVPRASSEANA